MNANGHAIVFGAESGQAIVYSNVVVANNTAVDCLGATPAFGLNPNNYDISYRDSWYVNNLAYNCRSANNPPITSVGPTNGLFIGYNYTWAGNDGGAGVVSNQVAASTGCNDAGTCSAQVQFQGYTELSPTNNLALSPSDTACRGQGTNLTAGGITLGPNIGAY